MVFISCGSSGSFQRQWNLFGWHIKFFAIFFIFCVGIISFTDKGISIFRSGVSVRKQGIEVFAVAGIDRTTLGISSAVVDDI